MAAPAVVWRGRAAAAVGQPASAPRRARTAREGKGQLQMKKGRTSVSCPFMASICSWRPAMVAWRLAMESVILAACGLARVEFTNVDSKREQFEVAFVFLRTTTTLNFWRLLGKGAAGAWPFPRAPK